MRLMTLHLSHMGFTEGLTFMDITSYLKLLRSAVGFALFTSFRSQNLAEPRNRRFAPLLRFCRLARSVLICKSKTSNTKFSSKILCLLACASRLRFAPSRHARFEFALHPSNVFRDSSYTQKHFTRFALRPRTLFGICLKLPITQSLLTWRAR